MSYFRIVQYDRPLKCVLDVKDTCCLMFMCNDYLFAGLTGLGFSNDIDLYRLSFLVTAGYGDKHLA